MSGWGWWWFVWLIGGFAVPETIALLRNPNDTLSWTVWRWFSITPGQAINQWSFLHFFLAAFMTWLLFHFVFGLFR